MAITQTHSRMVSDVDAGTTYLQGTLGTAANNGNGGSQTLGGIGATTLTITEIEA